MTNEERNRKLDEIIKELKGSEKYGPADFEYMGLHEIVEKLEKFRDEEL